MKCKNCKNVGHISIIEENKITSDTEPEVPNEELKGILFTIECRGLDVLEYRAINLLVTSKSGTKFEDADLTDTWCEYDEKTKLNVMIDQTKIEIVRNKSKW